jgi:hypothetical protein
MTLSGVLRSDIHTNRTEICQHTVSGRRIGGGLQFCTTLLQRCAHGTPPPEQGYSPESLGGVGTYMTCTTAPQPERQSRPIPDSKHCEMVSKSSSGPCKPPRHTRPSAHASLAPTPRLRCCSCVFQNSSVYYSPVSPPMFLRRTFADSVLHCGNRQLCHS